MAGVSAAGHISGWRADIMVPRTIERMEGGGRAC